MQISREAVDGVHTESLGKASSISNFTENRRANYGDKSRQKKEHKKEVIGLQSAIGGGVGKHLALLSQETIKNATQTDYFII